MSVKRKFVKKSVAYMKVEEDVTENERLSLRSPTAAAGLLFQHGFNFFKI